MMNLNETSRKILLVIILIVTKSQGFTLSQEKQQYRKNHGGGVKLTSRFFRVKDKLFNGDTE